MAQLQLYSELMIDFIHSCYNIKKNLVYIFKEFFFNL